MAIGTTAALLGAAAIGTAGSVASGVMGSKAAGKAADAQTQAAQVAAQVQRDAATQARIDAYPWALAGAQSLYAYMGELGIPMPKTPILPDLNAGPFAAGNKPGTAAPAAAPQTALGGASIRGDALSSALGNLNYRAPWMNRNQPALGSRFQTQGTATAAPAQPLYPSPQNMPMTAKKGFTETPGYAFQVEEGEKGVLNNLAALGMKNSGAALKALTRFRTGVANQEYNNYLNRLSAAAGMGQAQTNTTNQVTQNAASNIGQATMDAGAARASGYVGSANAWGNAIGNTANTWGKALGGMAYGNGGLY